MSTAPDAATFEATLAACRPYMSRLARRFARDAGEVEDLEQEARIAVWRAMHRYEERNGATLTTFACTCIRNALIDAWRPARLRACDSLDAEDREGLTLHHKLGSAPLQDDVVTASDVRGAVARLSERDRAIVTMLASGARTNEVVATLRVTSTQVRQAVGRLRIATTCGELPPAGVPVTYEHDGRALTIAGWSRAIGIPEHALRYRFLVWGAHRALETPWTPLRR